MLLSGDSGVALFPARGERVDVHGRFDALVHVGFRTSREGFEEARRALGERRIEFREMDHRVAWSLYLVDPDGYLVEITTYEPTKP